MQVGNPVALTVTPGVAAMARERLEQLSKAELVEIALGLPARLAAVKDQIRRLTQPPKDSSNSSTPPSKTRKPNRPSPRDNALHTSGVVYGVPRTAGLTALADRLYSKPIPIPSRASPACQPAGSASSPALTLTGSHQRTHPWTRERALRHCPSSTAWQGTTEP
jgi:hypothetical protein